MPFRFYSPGGSLFSLVVAGVLSLFRRGKNARGYSSPRRVENDYARVDELLASSEYPESETAEVYVLDPAKAAKTLQCQLGTKVTFAIKDESLYAVVNGQSICNVRFGYDSKVYDRARNNLPYEAYIVDRDAKASGFYDFFTVKVSY